MIFTVLLERSVFIFFFSSRRRHTRCSRDWSSDVCSSDLITYDFSATAGLALRGDYVNDENGARSSGVLGFQPNTGQKFGSATATLNIKAWPSAVVRPELRYDRSTLATFNGKKDQVTIALAVAYLY